jgi:type II protein arginine methyltransferase
MSDRSQALDALLPLAEGQPRAMAHLARLLQEDGHPERALDLCWRALAASPDDPELAALVASIVSTTVPSWHFRLVRDAARNRAYAAALARAIRSDGRVLEIGTGTGLLAMMAARAGAGAVVTCEATPVVARLAQEIVAINGYADRVRVIAGHSTALEAGRDVGGRADVLVSEIFSNDAVGEGAIPVIEDAWRRLLAPDARVIPARVRVLVALAEDRLRDHRRIGVVDGFDLSRFDRAAKPSYQISADAPRLSLRSKAETIFTFDFQRDRVFPSGHGSAALTATSAPINGIAQWIALDLDDHETYEARPGVNTRSCWATMFHPIDELSVTDAGRTVVIHGRHDRQSLLFWTATQ